MLFENSKTILTCSYLKSGVHLLPNLFRQQLHLRFWNEAESLCSVKAYQVIFDFLVATFDVNLTLI